MSTCAQMRALTPQSSMSLHSLALGPGLAIQALVPEGWGTWGPEVWGRERSPHCLASSVPSTASPSFPLDSGDLDSSSITVCMTLDKSPYRTCSVPISVK